MKALSKKTAKRLYQTVFSTWSHRSIYVKIPSFLFKLFHRKIARPHYIVYASVEITQYIDILIKLNKLYHNIRKKAITKILIFFLSFDYTFGQICVIIEKTEKGRFTK